MNERRHRERQIAEVLVRQGWGYLLGALGLEHLIAAERRWRGAAPAEALQPPAVRLRLTLEELGATFIKLGQLASTRADLLPPEYRVELAKLQDGAPRLPAEVVRDTIAAELGEDVADAFASFEAEPLAAASIGQAHGAVLHGGADVVVKVRRPGVVEEVEQDLEIVRNCATRVSRRWETAARYDLVGLVGEFAQTLRSELDYLSEGRNADRFAADFAGDPDVQIPRVFWERTTARVITLERMRGMKVDDRAALDAAGIDRPALARRAVGVMGKMVFQDGFFHADPHPGNFFIQPGGRIGVIDFGMVGTLSEPVRNELGRLLVALVRGDPERLAESLLGLGAMTAPVDRGRLREDLAGLLSRYTRRGLGEIPLAEAIGELLDIVRRHRLTVPRDVALLLKTFIEEEGLAAELDPDVQLIAALTPYAMRHMARQLAPAEVARRLAGMGIDLAELTVELPGRLDRLLTVLTDGGLDVRVRAPELEALAARAERIGNRVAAGVVAAAAIQGVVQLYAGRRHGPLYAARRRGPLYGARRRGPLYGARRQGPHGRRRRG
jgi:ubiquinone biosynthesis protein